MVSDTSLLTIAPWKEIQESKKIVREKLNFRNLFKSKVVVTKLNDRFGWRRINWKISKIIYLLFLRGGVGSGVSLNFIQV